MDCSTCAYLYKGGNCKAMKYRPIKRFCYATPEDAKQRETAIIKYIENAETETTDEKELKELRRLKRDAEKVIRRLEG